MRRLWLLIVLVLVLGFTAAQTEAAPRLIVIVVGDQVRADYLERFHKDLAPDGLRRFRDQGTYYTHARQDHAVTKTSPGHTLIGSGLYGKDSGIVGNDWYDVASHKSVSAAELIEGGKRTQLRWFVGKSLAQTLHEKCPDCRFVSLSLKDRGALLLGGPDQDEAYWWDMDKHVFRNYHESSDWLTGFNRRYHDLVSSKSRMAKADADTVTELLAEEVLQEWSLGQSSKRTDVLTVSFSAVDLVGHEVGPDAPELKSTFLNLDRRVAQLMNKVSQLVGKNVVWVFSSDHGVTPLPAGRVRFSKMFLPHPEWVEAVSQPFIYLSDKTKADLLKPDLEKIEGVQAVYTSTDIVSGRAMPEVTRDYYPGRCGDLWVVLKPHYIFSILPKGTTHGQPTEDDERVPLGFYGPGFDAKVSDQDTSVSIIEPCLLQVICPGQICPGQVP